MEHCTGNYGYRKFMAIYVQKIIALHPDSNRVIRKASPAKFRKKINCPASGLGIDQDRPGAVVLHLCHKRLCHGCFESGRILGVGLCGPELLAS